MSGPFVSASRAQTMLRDFDRLRRAIRAGDIKEADEALDKCERWISCIDPNATHPAPALRKIGE